LDKIEIALPNDDGGDYELVFNEGPTKEQAKAASLNTGSLVCTFYAQDH
jgi:hypothetical protein